MSELLRYEISVRDKLLRKKIIVGCYGDDEFVDESGEEVEGNLSIVVSWLQHLIEKEEKE